MRALFLALALSASTGVATAQQTLPSPGPINNYAGVGLYGQCVPNARVLETRLTGKTLPLLGATGVAADFWVVPTPGFLKLPRAANVFPKAGSVIIWGRQVGGTGHCAVVLGPSPNMPGFARVIDTNWRLDGQGMVRDVNLRDAGILGWLVP